MNSQTPYTVELSEDGYIHLHYFKVDNSKLENVAMSKNIMKEIFALLDENKEVHFQLLVEYEKNVLEEMAAETKEIYTKIASNKQISSIALLGIEEVHKQQIELLFEMLKITKKITFFQNKKEALLWLKVRKKKCEHKLLTQFHT
ncbi:hypothetical protein JKY72_05610 [Candidatus Gracilibacteria bacterium]|nr:hypothetical protein [Candidatus Gracilibacteria bacterium]